MAIDYQPAATSPRLTCDACGSTNLHCNNSRPVPEGRLRTYKCRRCGGLTRTEEIKIPREARR